ncbi:PAS domain-containing protein [Azospirillum lipoferum]|uniref:PAS domain-containing protein n=2 Tax=Azospirillaceae TaxID=2829815 RepID=A0A5A9GG32_AZOLI|nr:PAS domain-containing protein [Azospirillum lipoferum]KAA0592644.1 PAS domain-containing protein [Azospirillum lipoferum]
MRVSDEALLVLCGPDGSNLALSETTRRYFGPAASQMRGCGWISMIHPDDQLNAASSWLKAVYENAAYQLELGYRRYDGSYHRFAVTGVRYVDADAGQPHWLIVSEPLRQAAPASGLQMPAVSAAGGGPGRP